MTLMGGFGSGRPGHQSGSIRTASPTLRALLEHAKRRGISHTAIAEAIGATNGWAIGQYANGVNAPSILRVEEIAQAVGCRLVVLPYEEDADLLEALGYEVVVRRKGDDATMNAEAERLTLTPSERERRGTEMPALETRSDEMKP